jgi:hypothetical protein
LGTIAALDQASDQVTLTLDTGASLSTAFPALRHIEYGYATTSHSSQGATIDRVLVNVDTEQSVALVNQQQFYVSISRARVDAQVFTNKTEELAQAVNRAWPKSTALDAVIRSDDAPRFSQRREKSAKHRVLVQSAALEQHNTVLSPHPVHVSASHSESTARPGDRRHAPDAALRVSHHQPDWRREQQPPLYEQTVARAPANRRDERPVPPSEETQQQPERSRGIRHRR